ncbi:S8 family serine peptidase [Microtetraspora malaysiensis]|uniref:S8 family serine peptidase n=1 Tax=Microtetraspora malaysiensis TaxID=161358 RepID=UPI003D8FA0F6
MSRPGLRVGILAICIAMMVPTGHSASASPSPGDTDMPSERLRSVTLLTGDKVLFSPDGSAVRTQPAQGRANVRFTIRRDSGKLYVIPDDAAPLLNNGLLDERLFDVVGLDALGYGDDQRQSLPLIVQYSEANAARADTLRGTTVTRNLPSVNAVAAEAPKGDQQWWQQVASQWRPHATTLGQGVAKIWLDGVRHPVLDRSVGQIGAPEVWKAGYTGAGITVAVLDTGIDADHPDLKAKVADARDFTGSDTDDHVGHGTHVAATIASPNAPYKGVAPDAQLLIGKVCGVRGCMESDILAGMEWAAASKAKIVNMSLGGEDTPGLDPLEQAVGRLTEQYGTLFVVAAGNAGQGGAGTISSPATADAALAVGAVDRDERLAAFSSTGPRLDDSAIKPDVTAPGVDIVAARARDGQIGTPVNDTHTAMSGTSMATPHVAGAAALLLQKHPEWTGEQIKTALMASARSAPKLSPYEQGAGRIDVAAALQQDVTVSPPSVSFGNVEWPHADDEPVVRTLTYANGGDQAVTLKLRVAGMGPDGEPAPDGMFSLSTTTLTIGPKQNAEVTFTANTRGDMKDGTYGGSVLASVDGDATVATTPFAVIKEVESNDLEISVIDRNGQPADNYFVSIGAYDRRWVKGLYHPDGVLQRRLPRGYYALTAVIFTDDGTDQIVMPWLDLASSKSLTFDARTTKPLRVSVPDRAAVPLTGLVGFTAITDAKNPFENFTVAHAWDLTSRFGTAQLGPDAPKGRAIGGFNGLLSVPGPSGTPADASRTYNIGHFSPGGALSRIPEIKTAALAQVKTTYLRQGETGTGLTASVPLSKAVRGGSMVAPMIPVDLPRTRTDFYTTDQMSWDSMMFQISGQLLQADQTAFERSFQPGKRYEERYNGGGVFGPSLPGPADRSMWARHTQEQLRFTVPMLASRADAAGASATVTESTTVLRDGVQVCASTRVGFCVADMPPAAGRYQVKTEATRDISDLSTKVSAEWTFTYGGSRDPSAFPIRVVRFTPQLDDDNAAPARRTFHLPLEIQTNPGSRPGAVSSVTVEVSYDDGATWQRVPYVGTHQRGQVTLRHPAGGFVSLRATVRGTSDQAVTQTIIRAYRLR